MAKDLTVSLEDRPGTLADLGEALGKAGINIEGICGFGVEGRGIIHLLVEDAAAARKALEGAGIKVEGEADPIVTEVAGRADKPGELGKMARAIANAGVNVTVESSGTGAGMKLFCAGVGNQHPDIEDASRAIKKSEYDTCVQNGVKTVIEVPVGIDGLTIIEATNGPAMNLTQADIYKALAANPFGKGPNTMVRGTL